MILKFNPILRFHKLSLFSSHVSFKIIANLLHVFFESNIKNMLKKHGKPTKAKYAIFKKVYNQC